MGSPVDVPPESPTDRDRERLPSASAALDRWFKVTPAILHSINSEGRLIAVSDAWLAKFQYRREEVIGRRSSDFLTPASRDYAIRVVLPEFFRTGRRENVEYQMETKDGRLIDVLMSGVMDPGDGENGNCSVAVITDVTALRQAERKLAESEALYKSLVESQTDLVSLALPDGELCFVNQAYALHYNRQPHELIGTNLLDYVPEEFHGSVTEQLRQVCEGKHSVESENQVHLPTGETRWMSWTNRAIFDPAGKVTVIHSVGRDIERRVVAEARLKASEARYRMLADNSSDMVILVGKDGRRNYVSPACRKLLGWSPEEMLEMTMQDMVHADDFQKLKCALSDEGQDHLTLTYRFRRKDGAFTWVEAARQRIAIAGHPPAKLVVIRGIDQRVEAERRLKESEASYRLLADNSSDMVFQLDSDLVRRYVSPASRDILGYEPAELIGRKAVEKCHPEDAERVTAAFRSLLAGDVDRLSLINRRRHRDGRWIWVEAQLKALVEPQTGAPCGIIGALRDISLRKSIEDQLAQAMGRLEHLAAVDGLTGLANRRAFDEAIIREHRRALRESGCLALIMIDVDRFKSFNDHYGHPAGDECLKQVAQAISRTTRRPGDLAARYGGEEFAVLLPNTDEAGAAEVANQIRLAVCELGLKHENGTGRIVTISAGVSATGNDAHQTGPDELLRNSDRALYRAKDCGRDQVVNASWLPVAPTSMVGAVFA